MAVTGLTGLCTKPAHVVAFTNGEVHQQFSLCFTTTALGGELATDHESTEIAWTYPANIDTLDMHPFTRLRVARYLDQRPNMVASHALSPPPN